MGRIKKPISSGNYLKALRNKNNKIIIPQKGENAMYPFKTCADHFCCRSMCRNKKNYLDYIEGEVGSYKVKAISNKRVVVTTNKNGIRREEYR